MNQPADVGHAPTLELEGAKAIIRLNRPDVHNRLDLSDVETLCRLFADVDKCATARVLVITGSGRSFSSGFHLGALGERTVANQEGAFEAMTDALEGTRVPSIAVLNGPVYGGATDLALACDFRIAGPECRMFVPAARIGLHYHGNGLRRFVSRVGLAASKRLFLFGETFDAHDMARIGYVDEIVPQERLWQRAMTLADIIEAHAPTATNGMKRVLNAIARGEYDAAASGAAHKASLASAELAEGLAAWKDKRAPVFSPDVE